MVIAEKPGGRPALARRPVSVGAPGRQQQQRRHRGKRARGQRRGWWPWRRSSSSRPCTGPGGRVRAGGRCAEAPAPSPSARAARLRQRRRRTRRRRPMELENLVANSLLLKARLGGCPGPRAGAGAGAPRRGERRRPGAAAGPVSGRPRPRTRSRSRTRVLEPGRCAPRGAPPAWAMPRAVGAG